MLGGMGDSLPALESDVVACRACPRLVTWREQVAHDKVARFAEQTYWGRPVPGFGDPAARLVVVGLAPAAHGGNRTGRIFTGDRSGDFLFASLHRCGVASQPVSVSRDDGLMLSGVYVTAINRCAPPGNKPTTAERDRCIPFLVRELQLVPARVILALGAFAWDGAIRAVAQAEAIEPPRPRPRFGHGATATVGGYALVGAFHPSQQNTFTGRLTPAMLDEVVRRARSLAA